MEETRLRGVSRTDNAKAVNLNPLLEPVSLNLSIQPRTVFFFLSIVAVSLVGIGLATILYVLLTDNSEFAGNLMLIFNLGRETSIPTWYSGTLIFLSALSLLLVWTVKVRAKDRYRHYWFGLFTVFVLLSIDEVAAIHEVFGGYIVRSVVGQTSGLFFYSWVIAGGTFALVFALIFLKFLLGLPARTRWLFIVSGAMFVSGAVGMEMINGQHSESYGSWTPVYALGTGLEELLEMMGITLFLFAILDYVKRYVGGINVKLEVGV